jgi:hypothetical protein
VALHALQAMAPRGYTMFVVKRTSFVLFVSVSGSAPIALAQADRPYLFRSVASSSSALTESYNAPAMNNHGSIVFAAWRAGAGEALLTGPDFQQHAVIRTYANSPISSFGTAALINDVGTIAFDAVLSGSTQRGIYVAGDLSMNIATGSTGSLALMGLNNSGRVIASGRTTTQQLRLLRGQVGVAGMTTLAEPSPDDSGRFRSVLASGAALNNAGTSAFVARTWDFSGTFGYLTGIFDGEPDHEPLLDAADNLFRGINSEIDLNDSGALAFQAHRYRYDKNGDVEIVYGLYRADGTNLTQFATADADPESFTQINVNNDGNIAYLRRVNGAKAIYDGADLLRDRVIGPGDQLFGKTVSSVRMRRGGLNDLNEIAFQVMFADDSIGIAIAKPAAFGDADANGIINFDDYSFIDNGYNNNLTGWSNGDFDGNGVINFDDYSLIDNQFNLQFGGGDGNAGTRAVPEPSSLAMIAVATAFARRRR